MALTNFLQQPDALDFDGVTAEAHVWEATDDVTGQILTMYLPIGTSPEAAQNLMGDADAAENPPPDTITPGADVNEKDFRNSLITDFLPNWATLTKGEQRTLVRHFVYPTNTTVADLDALYTSTQRAQFLADVVVGLNDSGENFQLAPDGKAWNILPDVAGSLVTTELKSDGVV